MGGRVGECFNLDMKNFATVLYDTNIKIKHLYISLLTETIILFFLLLLRRRNCNYALHGMAVSVVLLRKNAKGEL